MSIFKNPFSFVGRIQRKEYIISFFVVRFIAILFWLLDTNEVVSSMVRILFGIIALALIWFQLAQATKRCHDRNNPGWFQLIPFYDLWLLFGDGDKVINQYGPSPKYRKRE